MTKPQKNVIFKAETVLFLCEWNPCFSNTVRVEMKDTIKVEVKDTKSLPSGNNDYLLTIKVCLNNSSVSRVWGPSYSGIPSS